MIGVIALVVALGLIQLVPSGITHPPVRAEPPWDSPETRALAVAACFDCHSNQTRTYWYERVAPVSWWIGNHVKEGRRSLNFSEWDPARHRSGRSVARTVRDGSMPPGYYTWLGVHGDAKLSAAQRDRLAAGLEQTFGAAAGRDGRGDDDR